MYALILAGGFATRLWPLTKDFPKPLLPLGEKRIIEYALHSMLKVELEKVFISTNAAFEHIFLEWVRKSRYVVPNKTELIFEPSISEEKKLGAIKGIDYDLREIGRRYRIGDLLIVAGDNIYDVNLASFIDTFRRKGAPVVAVKEIESKEEARRFAVVEVDDEGKILNFEEKPKKPRSTLIATAIYALPKDCVELIRRYLGEGNNPDAPGYFFQWLTKKIDVYAYKFEGFWFDIGAPKGYFDALKSLLRKTYISSKATVDGKIIGPSYIGNNVKVSEGSVVGPYAVICDGVTIRNSHINTALVMENSMIEYTKIFQTLVGYRATIKGGIIENSVLAGHTKLNIKH